MCVHLFEKDEKYGRKRKEAKNDIHLYPNLTL